MLSTAAMVYLASIPWLGFYRLLMIGSALPAVDDWISLPSHRRREQVSDFA